MVSDSGRVLLTGASGFVGGNVFLALSAAGYDVLCASRTPEASDERLFGRSWVRFDVHDASTHARAFEGCRFAVYLLHDIDDSASDSDREVAAAQKFGLGAAQAGVARIAYLGHVGPDDSVAAQVGRALGGAGTPVVELRPSLIIGFGAWRWDLLRDLTARSPVMVLPCWLGARLEPVAIDDVALAMVGALDLPTGVHDLPGPEAITACELLRRSAVCMGHRSMTVKLPIRLGRVSARWMSLVTRVGRARATQLTKEFGTDRLARSHEVWRALGEQPMRIETALELALQLDPVPDNQSLLEFLTNRLVRKADAA